MASILIVDDEDGIREVMSDVLDQQGHTVSQANNGVAGLKICAEKKIDLIVLDLNMPRMDGYMFMEHLRERWERDNRRFKFPEVLVLSAVDKQTDIGLAENLGASKFMHKPFRTAEFVSAVKGLLEKRSA